MFATEPTIIQAAQAGDLNAFNQLVLHYQNLAYSVARQTLLDDTSAADAVQDAFLRAWRAIHSFQGTCFKRWLLRILINRCYDELRIQRRRPSESLDHLVEQEEFMPQRFGSRESLEDYAERMELQHAIAASIQRLPADHRLMVTLCDIHGHDYAEIAEMTGLPMGTVKSRISRARAKLRGYLLQQQGLLPNSYLTPITHAMVGSQHNYSRVLPLETINAFT